MVKPLKPVVILKRSAALFLINLSSIGTPVCIVNPPANVGILYYDVESDAVKV